MTKLQAFDYIVDVCKKSDKYRGICTVESFARQAVLLDDICGWVEKALEDSEKDMLRCDNEDDV